MAHPEREIVRHFTYVTTRAIPIIDRVRIALPTPILFRDDIFSVKNAQEGCGLNYLFTHLNIAQIPITSHYLSYRRDEEMLICSRQRGEQHGIVRVSMRDFASNFHDFTPIHSKPIKDVQCYNGVSGTNKSYILTASLDKTLKVTNAESRQNMVS